MKLLTAEQYNMTTPLRQFILKRGNTAVSSTYTGPAGEITYDTGLNAVRIHDGITPGGNLMPSGTGYTSLISNVSVLQANVTTLFANAATQATYISTLQANVSTLQGLASSAGANPPDLPSEGALWYDSDSGRTYVYFDDFWIDASPETVYTLPTATASVLGGVKIGANLTIVDGVLSANTNLGNLGIANQTIYGTQTNQDIELAPNGTGFVSVPKLKIPVGTLVQGTANISVTIANLTLNSVVDYSTSSSDNLVIGDYNLTNGVSGAGTGWAVYEFTTTPTPALQVGDHIAGVGIPFLSNVLHIGTGPNANIVVTDQTITSVPPVGGTQIFSTRDIVSAGLNISTLENTDISLIPGTGGHIITTTDIIPFANDLYNLGTPAKRFKQVWLGAGTLYILDETLGTDQAIGARDGNIYIAGGTGLTVGKFTLTGNTIALQNSAEDFYVGAIGATGNLTVNRQFNVSSVDGAWKLFDINQTNGYVSIVSNVANSTGTAALEIVGARARDLISPNNPGILLHLTGTSTAPARIYNDSYGAANYSAYIGRKARGNSTVASGTVAGDIISRIGANPFDSSGVFAPISTMRMDFVVKETQTPTDRGNQIEFWTTANASASIARRVVIDDAGIALNTGGVKFVDSTVQTTAWLGDTSLDTVNANVTAANAAITALQSNTVTQTLRINSIATNAVNVVTAGFGMSVSRNNGTVGVDALGVTTVAGTANQVLVNAGTSAANAAITLTLPQSIAPSSTVTFANLTITGNLNVEGNIIASENVSLEQKILYLANTAPSQSDLDGGGIILGNVSAAFKRTFLYDYNSDRWDTNGAGLTTLELYAQEAIISGNVFSNGSAHFGATNMVSNFDNAEVQIDSNRNDFSQLIHQNHNSGTNASTDFVATNDIGTDESNFIDLGINSSTYTQAEYSITGPNDGYLFINGGNLAIGTQSAADVIRFHTGGTTSNKLRLTIDDNGLTVISNVAVGDTVIFADGSTQTTSANTIAQIINANLGTATNNITALYANAATQDTEIVGLRANITAVNLQISNTSVAVFANAASQQVTINALGAGATAANLNISALQSNTGVLANNINILFANSAAQESSVTGLRANITAANARIQVLDANLGTATTNITTLFGNAATQQTEINALQANITAANSAIVTANNAVVSYVNNLNSQMVANVNAANIAAASYTNLQIQTVTSNWQANASIQEDEISALRANVIAANAAIVTANSAVVSYVNTLNLSMIANVNAANALIVGGSYGNANVAVYLPYNATIQGINANVAAANAAIVTANSAVVSYVNTLNSAMTANVIAANGAIVTANTGMKNYVDAQIGTAITGFASNAATQQTEIVALRANITAANGAIITANTGMKSYVDAQISSIPAGVSSLAGGNNIVLSGSTGSVTIQRVDGLQGVITGNSAASANLSLTDQYFGTTRSATGTGTVTLPAGSAVSVGRQYIIKDEGGSSGSGSRRITVATTGSDTIDGSATRAITSNYGSLTVLWTGTRWSVI
jgi:hypothetical protein